MRAWADESLKGHYTGFNDSYKGEVDEMKLNSPDTITTYNQLPNPTVPWIAISVIAVSVLGVLTIAAIIAGILGFMYLSNQEPDTIETNTEVTKGWIIEGE